MGRKRKLQEEDAVPCVDDLDAWALHPRLLRHVECLVASKNPLLGVSGEKMMMMMMMMMIIIIIIIVIIISISLIVFVLIFISTMFMVMFIWFCFHVLLFFHSFPRVEKPFGESIGEWPSGYRCSSVTGTVRMVKGNAAASMLPPV